MFLSGRKSSSKTWRQESRQSASFVCDDSLMTFGLEITSPWNINIAFNLELDDTLTSKRPPLDQTWQTLLTGGHCSEVIYVTKSRVGAPKWYPLKSIFSLLFQVWLHVVWLLCNLREWFPTLETLVIRESRLWPNRKWVTTCRPFENYSSEGLSINDVMQISALNDVNRNDRKDNFTEFWNVSFNLN